MTEHEAQCVVIQWAAWNQQARPELKNLFAIPNGGHRHIATAVKLRNEGVRPGVPDLFLAWPKGNFSGLFIELKVKGGRLSSLQKDWIKRLSTAGYRAEVCFGPDEVIDIISGYLSDDRGV